ncbi:MAG: lipid-A-disaccharide synthase [Nitrospirae bacterium]|nr:lipid-A-disaccharide synthase [Nitrospirota bacterium]
MIVTGETSGELYGALLAASLREKVPGIRIIGIGGERMKAAGVELISGISSAFGLTEAFSSFNAIRKTYARAKDAIRIYLPALLVLIDYPDFNLRLAAEAKRHGIRVLYYVSPQVWAWRKKRVKKIVRLVDKMAVILPFEEEIYKGAGLDCEFVGHPVFDEIQNISEDKREMKRVLGMRADIPLISLLPGSRPHEIDRLLPVLSDVIREIRHEFKEMQFCIPFAPNTDLNMYGQVIERMKREGVLINKGESLRVLAASDVAVIASGTASLQAALLGTPALVIYKLFPLTYWLGKFIVHVRHISLVNILSGREVIREMLQSDVTARNIAGEIKKMLSDGHYREQMLLAYNRIRQIFSGKNASERVAEMVIQIAGLKK